jgi:hypothetical protein
MRMSKWKVFVLILGFVGVGLFLVYENCAVVQSETKIRHNMLKKFPVGTEKERVRKYIKSVNPSMRGVYHRNTGWSRNYKDPTIGVSRIRAPIATFWIIADITVIWIFDKNDKLEDIAVWRTIDLL